MITELRLLGGAALFAADGRPIGGAASQPRRIAVLAVLAGAWPATVTRDRLIGLIWPDHEDAGARRLLTQSLYALRRELGEVVRSAGRDLALDTEVLAVDLVAFRRALADGDLERAAELYRPVLEGVHLRGAAEFERWAESLRDETRRQFQGAVERVVRGHEAAGRHREAARWGERMLHAAPYDASAVRQVIELWERVGDRGAAHAAVAAYERRMREELEVDPDPAVRRRLDEMRPLAPECALAAEPPAAGSPPVATAAPPSHAVVGPVGDPSPVDLSASAEPVAAPPPAPPAPPTRPAPPSGAFTGRRRTMWRGWAWRGAMAAALASTGLIVAARAPARRPSPTTPALELLPFAVGGDSAGSDSLGAALTSILAANLDGGGGVRVERAAGGGSSGRQASEDRGGPAGARRLWGTLGGTILVTGRELRLDADLRPSDPGARPTHVTVTGARDSLIALAERLSLLLVPALYPELAPLLDGDALRRVASAPSLRRLLDGEAAIRRGAFDDAYEHFRQATAIDSSQAHAWYRRAVAAELAHRTEDADRSIAAAVAREGTLTGRERLLVRAYSRWRAGDATEAESIVRRIVETAPRDRDAWLLLGEIAYHAWPLHGKSLDAARDVWRQVVALDSADHPALQHAVRLEARGGDTAAVAALLRMGARVAGDEGGPQSAEGRVIAAYAAGDRAVAAIRREVDALPDYGLDFVHGAVAGLLERPAAAAGIARRMTATGRPDAVQAAGHVALAHLALAQGRVGDAWRELDRASTRNPVAAAWSRAYLAALPFVPTPDSARRSAARALAAARQAPDAAPLYLQLAVDASAAPEIERYLAELLRLADVAPSPGAATAPASGPRHRAAACAGVTPTRRRDLCIDLGLGLAAEEARRAGRHAEALAALEAIGMRVPYQFAGRSVFFARTRERYLRAVLLEEAGRLDEAYRWYEAVPHGARLDYVYLAPAHLGRGRIRERQGDRAAAADHYRRVLELWPSPDPSLLPLQREARDGLARVSTAIREGGGG